MNIELIAQNAIKINTENGKVIYIDPFKYSLQGYSKRKQAVWQEISRSFGRK